MALLLVPSMASLQARHGLPWVSRTPLSRMLAPEVLTMAAVESLLVLPRQQT